MSVLGVLSWIHVVQTTVCVESWLNSFVELLSDFDTSAIVEKKSTASFTFGDGVSIKSLKCLV